MHEETVGTVELTNERGQRWLTNVHTRKTWSPQAGASMRRSQANKASTNLQNQRETSYRLQHIIPMRLFINSVSINWNNIQHPKFTEHPQSSSIKSSSTATILRVLRSRINTSNSSREKSTKNKHDHTSSMSTNIMYTTIPAGKVRTHQSTPHNHKDGAPCRS